MKTNENWRLEEIEQEIEEIKKSLPAHSIPATMLLELEELEEKLEQLQLDEENESRASD